MASKKQERTIMELAMRWRFSRDEWRTAWPRAVMRGRRGQSLPFHGRLPDLTPEYQAARAQARSTAESLVEVVAELLPLVRRAGLDRMALLKLQRDLRGKIELIAVTHYSGTDLKPAVAEAVDEVDLIVRELEAQNLSAEPEEAPSAPRQLTELDRRTIEVLEKAGRPVKLDELVSLVSPDIRPESFRRRLWLLGKEGKVCRNRRGRYWHPSVEKTEK